MQIVLVRIDDRLIHGQVVIGWIPHLRVNMVMVVSDAVAADETQVALMRMAMPERVSLVVLPVMPAAQRIRTDTIADCRALILTPGPLEVLRLLEAGAEFKAVNVGGLHYTAGRVQLGRAIFLSADDRVALRALCRRGVNMEGRALPGDAALDVVEMIGDEGAR